MPARTFRNRLRAFLDPRPARWRTVIVLGIVLGYGNGYVLVALTGAAGAIERTNHPFSSWLVESAILVPLFILAQLLVLRRVRRRRGPVLRSWKAVLVTALMIAVAGMVTGFVSVTVSAALDYRLQAQLIDFSSQFDDQNGDPLITAGSTAERGNCNSMACNEKRLSLAGDARAVAISAPLLLGVNVVLVGWVLAGFGGRLGASGRRTATATIAVPASTEKV